MVVSSPTTQLLKRYQRLVEVMHNLASTLDLDLLLKNIMDVAVDLVVASEASILLYDPHQRRLHFETTTNEEQLPLLRDIPVPEESIAGWVALHRQPQIINNVRQDDRHFEGIDKQVNFHTSSMIAVPLVAQDKLIGVLEVLNKKDNGSFDTEDQEILLALGAEAAIAIENSRLFQQSNLIAEFVHELRTPLSSVLTAAYLLQRPVLETEPRLKLSAIVYQETQRLNELATIFLDLASLESGRSALRPSQIDVNKLLEECYQLLQLKATEQSIEIILDAPTALPGIEADQSKLKQALLNLLNNAVKYNRPNGKVWLKAAALSEHLVITIQDTGVGIPPDQITKLFTKFFRASNVEGKTPGTGLGLSITKRIIEMHGGEVKVESQLDHGTTFTITLPSSQI